MKDNLMGIKSLGTSPDIHALQFEAPDEESFFILFAVLQKMVRREGIHYRRVERQSERVLLVREEGLVVPRP